MALSGLSWLAMLQAIIYLSMVCLAVLVTAKPREGHYDCGACLALVDELKWEVAKIDPKKTVKVGSYRVNPKGEQNLQEIPLARSESKLGELVESACESMRSYALCETDGRRSYVRLTPHDGSSLTAAFTVPPDMPRRLQAACEDLVEEHEEEIVASFQVGMDDITEMLCMDLFQFCSAQNVTDYDLIAHPAVPSFPPPPGESTIGNLEDFQDGAELGGDDLREEL